MDNETIEITQKQAKDLVVKAKGNKFFTVEFVKRTNGKTRVMNCRKGVKKGTRGGALRFQPLAHDLVSVFDIPKRLHRFISLDEIKRVNINGKRHIVVT